MLSAKDASRHREYMRAYKARRRAQGLCYACGVPSERPQCDHCLERHKLRQRQWRQRPDEKRKRCARESVRKALKNGALVKPAACEGCKGEGLKLQAHHRDYSKYRDVTWLCLDCHGRDHRKHSEAA